VSEDASRQTDADFVELGQLLNRREWLFVKGNYR
jgi:hypothetical protein